MLLEKYSIGMGDRFGRQGVAQLRALVRAKEQGCDIVPVWNKSHREHTITATSPASVRREADAAVKALDWKNSYYVDADHIGLKNVDLFLDASDFFTIDVADFTGQSADEDAIRAFVDKHQKYCGSLKIPGLAESLKVSVGTIEDSARKYLLAVSEAGKIFRHIEARKGAGNFVAEVSMDETNTAQSPVELLFVLAAIAGEKIQAQTVAPKFTGRFNKGVDYVGNVDQFAREFEADIAVIAFAVREFGLPGNLKLSVHSGSDKFSIYGAINRAVKKHKAGLHVKTAGTTWLEEVIGLALAGGSGLELAKEIYREARPRFDEFRKPYVTVIDIDPRNLPKEEVVAKWSGEEFAAALRHDPSCKSFNADFRQFIHIAYKVAAEMGDTYLNALESHETVIAGNVTDNLFERHLKPLFM